MQFAANGGMHSCHDIFDRTRAGNVSRNARLCACDNLLIDIGKGNGYNLHPRQNLSKRERQFQVVQLCDVEQHDIGVGLGEVRRRYK